MAGLIDFKRGKDFYHKVIVQYFRFENVSFLSKPIIPSGIISKTAQCITFFGKSQHWYEIGELFNILDILRPMFLI